MKKKMVKNLIGVLFVAILISGCQEETQKEKQDQEQQVSQEKTQGKTQETDDGIHTVLTDQMTVDIPQVPQVEQTQAKIEVNPAQIDLMDMKACFFSEDTSETRSEPLDENVDCIKSADGLTLIYGSGVLNGFTREWEIYNAFIEFRKDEDIEMHITTDGNLDFCSRADVEKKVNELVSEMRLGLEIDNIEIEGFTQEYFAELVEQISENPLYTEEFLSEETKQRDWSTVDELYLVDIGFRERKLPIDKNGYAFMDDSSVAGMNMQIGMTKQGVQFFQMQSPVEKGEIENIEICSAQEALEAIAQKYRNIITDGESEITGVRLEYDFSPDAMTGQMYLIPVYRFTQQTNTRMYSEEKPEGEYMTVDGVIRVNAQTGRLIE